MKTITLSASLLLGAFITPTAAVAQAAPGAIVVVVDSERIYRECTACRAAQTALQGQVNGLQARQKALTDQIRPEGQSIQTGDTILVLEAMKMETNITAPMAGKIVKIRVNPGDSVKAGMVLVEFE